MRLSATHITFAYNTGHAVLCDVSLTLGAGEIIGILGPNGAGKSTLLQCLAGLLHPQQGVCHLEDKPVADWSGTERARRLSFVTQEEAATLPFSVLETVLMGRAPYEKFWGFDTAADLQAAHDALARLDLTDLQSHSILEISGGERQRARLARALAQHTPLLLLDEPAAHLDIRHQVQILRLLQQLVRGENRTVVMTLHDINLAASVCQRILLLREGRLLADGSPATVLTEPNLTQLYEIDLTVSHEKSGTPRVHFMA